MDHGVGPLAGVNTTGRMAGVTVAVVLGIRVAGCFSLGEILWAGIGVLSLPWDFGLGWENWESAEFLHWVHCKLLVVPWWFWWWDTSLMFLLDWFWWTV